MVQGLFPQRIIDKMRRIMVFFQRGITLTVGGYNLALSNGGDADAVHNDFGFISIRTCYYRHYRTCI